MYKLNYSSIDGRVCSIQTDNMSIPLCEDNSDYQTFLRWNTEQDIPLDLGSTIPVIPTEPARDLMAELDVMKVDIAKLKAGKVDK